MILPTKHIAIHHSLVGVGATILEVLRQPATISSAWDKYRSEGGCVSFNRFVMALDFLYAIGAIEYSRGLLQRTTS